MHVQVNGTSVFINTGGGTFDASKPTAVLIHGAGCDHSVWSGQNRYLAHHGVSVLALDLPGHGRSGGTAIRGIEEMADFVVRLVEEIGVERPVPIGHSMGSFVALETAARLGERASGLGLCGAAAAMPVHPALLSAAQKNEVTAAELVSSWGHGGRAHRGGNPAHGMWLVRGAVRLIHSMPPGALFTGLSSCADYEGALSAATNVSCPTLFVLGARDKMTPAKTATPLLDAVAGAQSVVIPNCGHMMMSESPHETRDALMRLVGMVKSA